MASGTWCKWSGPVVTSESCPVLCLLETSQARAVISIPRPWSRTYEHDPGFMTTKIRLDETGGNKIQDFTPNVAFLVISVVSVRIKWEKVHDVSRLTYCFHWYRSDGSRTEPESIAQ